MELFEESGEHGDVPVLPDSGAKYARLVVEKHISIVLDVSGFRQGERKRFATDFAEEFFHLKKSQRSAVHLFVEEAQLFAPQRVRPDEARMLGAFENIIRLGRNYGVGATMISQRPQSINKEVLSQVECLCVLQVNGTHERKALEEWVQEAGADRKLVGELPGLSRGEGFVWSPSWLRRFDRVRFSKKTTFDASATPEVGRSTRAAKLAPVDIEALKNDIQEVIAKAKEDDPKELKARIRELQRNRDPQADPALVRSLQSRIRELESYSSQSAKTIDNYRSKLAKIASLSSEVEITASIPTTVVSTQRSIPRPIVSSKPSAPRNEGADGLRAGARRMLAVLCQWYPSGRTESQLAAQVQMKKTGGTWAAYKSDLRKGGFVEIGPDGLWYATDAGRDYLGADIPDTPTTTEEVVSLWGEKLRKGAREMLDVLVHHGGNSVSRESLGRQVSMESSGGTFAAYLSDLRQAGLIVVDRDGIRANEETLFL